MRLALLPVCRPILRLSLLADVVLPVHSCRDCREQEMYHHFGLYNTGSQVDSGGDQLPFGLRLPALSSLDRVLDAAGT